MARTRERAQHHHGSNYVKPNQIAVFDMGEGRIGAITPGRKSGIRRKRDGNEDAIASIPINHQIDLFLIADAHYGAMPANYAIDHFEKHFREIEGSNPRRLFITHLLLDEAIRGAKDEDLAAGASTTLLSVAVKGDTAAFCATGDSPLFLLRGGKMEEMYERHQGLFLGDGNKPIDRFVQHLAKLGAIDDMTTPEQIRDTLFQLTKIYKQVFFRRVDPPSIAKIIGDISHNLGIPFPIEPEEISEPHFVLNTQMAALLPVWGSFTLKAGDLLLLSSDGIDEQVSGVPLAEVQTILEDQSLALETRAETLLQRSLGKNGGQDNLSLILIQI